MLSLPCGFRLLQRRGPAEDNKASDRALLLTNSEYPILQPRLREPIMDWFSFVAGLLAGWIIQWLIDLFYWRRKQSRWAGEQSRLQADLSHTQGLVGGLRTREAELSQQLSVSRGDYDAAANNLGVVQADLDAARSQIAALNNDLARANAERLAATDQLNADLAVAVAGTATVRDQFERAQADIRALQAENATLKMRKDELEGDTTRLTAVNLAATAAAAAATAAAVAAEEALANAGDDLTIIEGIGPKIAELLNQNEIRTFEKLADTSVPDLEVILRGGGNRFQTANPETWPRQARLAANRDWPRLDLLKAQLQGGVKRPAGEAPATRSQAAPEPSDDLAVIEGIGPKISEILNRNGIRTFAQLARMEPARLRLILEEAGPAYRVADPSTWPEQASWAAVGNWERLQVLKDELNAGRRQP
jgi:predicted flap endonuclease-1-like 5' DNA nuclease